MQEGQIGGPPPWRLFVACLKEQRAGLQLRPLAESSEFSGKRNPVRAPDSCSHWGAGVNQHPVVSTKKWASVATGAHLTPPPTHQKHSIHKCQEWTKRKGWGRKKREKECLLLFPASVVFHKRCGWNYQLALQKGAGKSDWGCNHF